MEEAIIGLLSLVTTMLGLQLRQSSRNGNGGRHETDRIVTAIHASGDKIVTEMRLGHQRLEDKLVAMALTIPPYTPPGRPAPS